MNINNNRFELKPSNSKRKVVAPCPNVYLNPALDILANEDRMCNNKMEIVPVKKRKRTRSCEIAAFENSGLDLGISKAAVNEFLVRELDNVRKNVKLFEKANDEHTDRLANNSNKPNNHVTKKSTDFSDALHNAKVNFDDNIARINLDRFCSNYEFKTDEIKPAPLPRSDIPKNSSLPNITLNITDAENIYANANDLPVSNNVIFDKNIPKENESQLFVNTEHTLNSNVDNDLTNNAIDNNIFKSYIHSASTTNNIEPEPIYANLTEESNNFRSQLQSITNNVTVAPFLPNVSGMDSGVSPDQNNPNDLNISAITNIQTTVTNQYFVNNSNISLSFIDRLALESPNTSNQSLYLDDDLNESNIMEIKTITIITKKKKTEKKNTNPFLEANTNRDISHNNDNTNPFIDSRVDEIYNDDLLNRPIEVVPAIKNIIPRQLFTETNSTISTVNESMLENHYENVSGRSESPIYENLDDLEPFNKQSKILGHDVSKFSATDILNLNKINQSSNSQDSSDSKKDFKNKLVKVSNKLSKKVFKTLKKKFKTEKVVNTTLNPYEVSRKPIKKVVAKESGIENPALNLDNSDEIEIEEIDNEPEYETIKTIRNTRLNMNVTPLKERVVDNIDTSIGRVTPGKKVRFDSTLNQEKVITGDSFDYDLQSPGFDAKIDKYHDELENCINERKFLQQM